MVNKLSFSFEGEDKIIYRYFGNRKGRYFDLGSGHPIIYSNTYFLYLKGWRGVCVDAHEPNISKANFWRSADINLHSIVADGKEHPYYEFKESSLNTINPGRAMSLGELYPSMMVSTVDANFLIRAYNLQDVEIFDCDIEDYDIVKLIDWSVFKPEVVMLERTEFKNPGYKLYAQTSKNKIYVRK